MRIFLQFIFQIMASQKFVCQKIFFQRIGFCCQWIFFGIVTLIAYKMVKSIPKNCGSKVVVFDEVLFVQYLSSLLRKGNWQSKHISSSNSFGWKNRLSRALLSPVRSRKPAPVSTTLRKTRLDSYMFPSSKFFEWWSVQDHTSHRNFLNQNHFHCLHLNKNSANTIRLIIAIY